MEALEKAICEAGGTAELARRLGTSIQVVSNWKRRGVPAERCREVELAVNGKVKRGDLRPDVFGRAA